MYLDCDTTPPTRSHTTRDSRLAANINTALAILSLNRVIEGQIGIYDNYLGTFRGYVIKYPNETPFFEPAEEQAA